MKSSHEWVIELHQISFDRWVTVGPSWMEMSNKHAPLAKHLMDPTTLDKCLEVMIFWCNYQDKQGQEFKYSERLRVRNINTGELIPVEALGL